MSNQSIHAIPGDAMFVSQSGSAFTAGMLARMSGEARGIVPEFITTTIGTICGAVYGTDATVPRPPAEVAGWDFADRLIFVSDKLGYGERNGG
jgi:hypothetical protein